MRPRYCQRRFEALEWSKNLKLGIAGKYVAYDRAE